MKSSFKAFLLILCLAVTAPLAQAANPESAPTPPPDNSSVELKRIKALEGRWSSTTDMFGTPNEKVYVEYEVTAGGSAVLEKIFPGTPHEMISVYYDDNDGKLAMTHYCMMRNRPNFKLAKSAKNSLVMDVVKVDGLQSPDAPSMGAITIKFKDKDRFSTTCESRGKGSEGQKPMTMEYTRVK